MSKSFGARSMMRSRTQPPAHRAIKPSFVKRRTTARAPSLSGLVGMEIIKKKRGLPQNPELPTLQGNCQSIISGLDAVRFKEFT